LAALDEECFSWCARGRSQTLTLAEDPSSSAIPSGGRAKRGFADTATGSGERSVDGGGEGCQRNLAGAELGEVLVSLTLAERRSIEDARRQSARDRVSTTSRDAVETRFRFR